MAIERVDNWELEISTLDLVDNKMTIEDSHIRAALIREIGTDQADPMVSIGIRDRPYMSIDSYIAPYYKSSNNLNVMRLSGKKGLKWAFTGFELPLPVDTELEITGLEAGKRVYLRGSLYKRVLSMDDPINKYLLARSIEHSYKQLRPLYFKDITIPVGLSGGKEYVLDTQATPNALVEWKPADPHYTMVPTANIYYVIRNTIQVLWNEPDPLPRDIEFRMKHDAVDVGVMPRLDHMFMPPADGITRLMSEILSGGKISDCELIWTQAPTHVTTSADGTDFEEGTHSAKMEIADAFGTGIVAHRTITELDLSGYKQIGFWIKESAGKAAGVFQLKLCSDTDGETGIVDTIDVPLVASGTWTYVVADLHDPHLLESVKSVALHAASDPAAVDVWLDDIRGLPLKVSSNPVQEFTNITCKDVAGDELTCALDVVNYANGEFTITYDEVPVTVKVDYYAMRMGGGRDIFSLREIDSVYHTVKYPHRQSYVFVNKWAAAHAPTGDYTMSLYTLAEYHQTVPEGQAIPASVIASARELLV